MTIVNYKVSESEISHAVTSTLLCVEEVAVVDDVAELVEVDETDVVELLLEALAKHLPAVGFIKPMLGTSVMVRASPGLGYWRAFLEVLRHSPGPIWPVRVISPTNISGRLSSVLVPEPAILTDAQSMQQNSYEYEKIISIFHYIL
jgi:hypothetical protein